ncbi:MAG: hypothetical protein RIG77_16795 [Cyclobacteriaceae bacterium]
MSDSNLTIRLKSLTCFQNDEDKFDDVFIKHEGKKIWPTDKKHEDVSVGNYKLGVDISGIKPNSEVILEIWDHDTFSPNDLLGSTKMIPDQPGGPYQVDMQPAHDSDIARYSIEWQVLWPDQM